MKPVRRPVFLHLRKSITIAASGMKILVVSDTHGRPHPDLDQRVREAAPGHILHAGDIGDLTVLNNLRKHAPVTAVRGNIDDRSPDMPDAVTITIEDASGCVLKILLVHVGIRGLTIRADVARLARTEGATVVVCGHSHIPFAAHDRGLTVFNPGSAGPRRFQLPVVFGIMDVKRDGVSVRHVSCETGLPWTGR